MLIFRDKSSHSALNSDVVTKLKRELRSCEQRREKEIALLQQELELQKLQVEELKDREQMQKSLYNTMMSTFEEDINKQTIQNQVQMAQKIYEKNIADLKSKHKTHLSETVKQYTSKCENLFAYIKEAERLLDEMDGKRKRERKDLQTKHQYEISKLQKSFENEITDLKFRLKQHNTSSSIDKIINDRELTRTHQNQQVCNIEAEQVKTELSAKSKMLEDANDQIVCLKSKLHGLRTIVTQLRDVESKYKRMKTKVGKGSIDDSIDTNIYIMDEPVKTKKLGKSRNSIMKTSRTKNDISLYEETFSSAKRSKGHDVKRKFKNSKRKQKMKIGTSYDKGSEVCVTHEYYPFSTLNNSRETGFSRNQTDQLNMSSSKRLNNAKFYIYRTR